MAVVSVWNAAIFARKNAKPFNKTTRPLIVLHHVNANKPKTSTHTHTHTHMPRILPRVIRTRKNKKKNAEKWIFLCVHCSNPLSGGLPGAWKIPLFISLTGKIWPRPLPLITKPTPNRWLGWKVYGCVPHVGWTHRLSGCCSCRPSCMPSTPSGSRTRRSICKRNKAWLKRLAKVWGVNT